MPPVYNVIDSRRRERLGLNMEKFSSSTKAWLRWISIYSYTSHGSPMMLLSASSSERSMSSTMRLSSLSNAAVCMGDPPGEESGLGAGGSASSSSAETSRLGWPSSMPWNGDSEPVGDGASADGEGMGESSRSGKEALRASSLRFRWDTRLAKAW